jgi:hypothetical protein
MLRSASHVSQPTSDDLIHKLSSGLGKADRTNSLPKLDRPDLFGELPEELVSEGRRNLAITKVRGNYQLLQQSRMKLLASTGATFARR